MKKILFFAVSALLLAAAGCQKTDYKFPFLNPSLSVEKRAADIVSRLTLEEKVAQMLNSAPGIDSLGIPPYDWWNEALHGVARTEYVVTVYPQAIAMAAGWDADAMKIMGDFTAEEARAVYNLSQARHDYRDYHGLTFWSPNINIFRDPRWGRGQETYGEDPYLTGVIGSNFVRGLQGDNPRYLKAAACAKHYAVHSGPESLRHEFDVSVSNYDLWDTYLPAFKTLITEADVVGVMCAYNAWQGQPCCGSDLLMQDILRNQWKFTGYVTSDCGAINDFYNYHKTHPDAPHAAADAVIHGTDVDCGNEAYFGLVQAVKDGLITEQQIDASLRRLFEIRIRLGMFDPKASVPYNAIDSSALAAKIHRDLSLRMAQQSIVLLKNDGTLPLDRKSLKKVALVGPNIDREEVQLGNYNGFPQHVFTPLEGIRAALGDVELVAIPGCSYTSDTFEENLNVHQLTDSVKIEYFNNRNLQGKPVWSGVQKRWRVRSSVNSPAAEGVNLQNYSSRMEGDFTAPLTGNIEFRISYDDGYRFYIDGRLVASDWGRDVSADATCVFKVQKDRKYRLRLEQYQGDNGGGVSRLDAWRTEKYSAEKLVADVKDADVIIFVGGITPRLEGEEMPVNAPGFSGGDRTSILLPAAQTETMKALRSTGKPVVFVMMTGSALATPWESENVNAIVNAWYGGEFAGNAIADVLFGDFNPSGKLPVTFYASDADLPGFENYDMAGRTYKYFAGKPLYPFGFGLSYTTFEYDWAKQPKKEYKTGETIDFSATVSNTGDRDGDAVAQAYIKYPSGRNLPLRELRAFQRRSLAKGGSATIEFTVPVADLAKWDDAAGKLETPRGDYTIFVGNNSADEAITAEFTVK